MNSSLNKLQIVYVKFLVHQLIDKNTKKSLLCFCLLLCLIELRKEELSSVAQVFWKRITCITCYAATDALVVDFIANTYLELLYPYSNLVALKPLCLCSQYNTVLIMQWICPHPS